MTTTRHRIIIQEDESLNKTGITVSPTSDVIHASASNTIKKRRHHYSKKVWKRRSYKHKRYEANLNYGVVLVASGILFKDDFKDCANSSAPLKQAMLKINASGRKREILHKLWKAQTKNKILF